MRTTIKIRSKRQSVPAGKLADVEIHFTGDDLDGLKLVGFGLWKRATATAAMSRSPHVNSPCMASAAASRWCWRSTTPPRRIASASSCRKPTPTEKNARREQPAPRRKRGRCARVSRRDIRVLLGQSSRGVRPRQQRARSDADSRGSSRPRSGAAASGGRWTASAPWAAI